jgi:hypothetical protein
MDSLLISHQTSYTFLVLLLSPECVSPAKAVEMWG